MIRRPACPIEAFDFIKDLIQTVDNNYDVSKFPNHHKLLIGLDIVMKNDLIKRIPECAQRNMFSRIIINSSCPILQKFIIEPEHYEKLYNECAKNIKYNKRLKKYKCFVDNVTINAKNCLKRENIDEELRYIANGTVSFFENDFLFQFMRDLFICLKSLRRISKHVEKRSRDTFLKYNTFSSNSSLTYGEAEDIARQFE